MDKQSTALRQQNQSLKATLSLFAILIGTMAWGSSFYLIQRTTQEVGILPFLLWRFAVAVLALALVFPKKILNVKAPYLSGGSVLGLLLFLTLLTQTIGLRYTTAGKSGFVTALYVPMTPIAAWLFLGQKTNWRQGVTALVAVIGLYVLTLQGATRLNLGLWWKDMNVGDLWTIGAAWLAALHIVFTEKFSRRNEDSIALGFWQFAFCFLFLALSVGFEPSTQTQNIWNLTKWSSFSLWALAFNALVGTCFAFIAQIVAQKTVGSFKAALVFALEAPFSLGYALLMGQAMMTGRELMGAGILFVTSGIPEKWLRKR